MGAKFATVDTDGEISWFQTKREAELDAKERVQEGRTVVWVFELKSKVSRSVEVEEIA